MKKGITFERIYSISIKKTKKKNKCFSKYFM